MRPRINLRGERGSNPRLAILREQVLSPFRLLPFLWETTLFFKEFRNICQDYCREFGIPFPSKRRYKQLKLGYDQYISPDADYSHNVAKYLDTINWDNETMFCDIECKCIELAPLPKAVPVVGWDLEVPYPVDCKTKGNKPMRYNDNYAVATVSAPQSDASTQRDYLLGRLAKADYPKTADLTKLFNLYTDNSPKTYKELIDVIKNDKFTLNKKIVERVDESMAEADDEDGEFYHGFGPFHGIEWNGPKADRKGFNAAQEEQKKQYTAAKDIIMTADAAAGLAAVQAFEAWTPTVATTTVQ